MSRAFRPVKRDTQSVTREDAVAQMCRTSSTCQLGRPRELSTGRAASGSRYRTVMGRARARASELLRRHRSWTGGNKYALAGDRCRAREQYGRD
jgi:hypothetical protein